MQNDIRDRLIKFLKNEVSEAVPHCLPSRSIMLIADHIVADGWIRPPCKVGQTVYCVYNDQVVQGTVRLIRPFISKEEIVFKGNIICEFDSIFYDDGRKEEIELYVVFEKPYGCERVAYFTKEKAEQKLKEMRVENG